jgi:DNA excision repair protein ERCC-5
MIADVQHLLMLFGCPFIVAPQEAESQCAQLEQLGLVHGTITDDNDILLFGGRKVYRHMCSRSKSPALYVADDVEKVLGLDRVKLISLAYFLGSDYNEGIKV